MDHRKSKRVPEKHLLLLYWLHQSIWLCGSQKNSGKFLKRWEYWITWPASKKSVCRSRSNNWTWNNRTCSKLGKGYVKALYCHSAYLTYMQSTLCKILGWSRSNNRTWNNILVPNQERSTSRLCILSPCLFNLYAEYIMQNAELDEAQAGIKIAGKISIISDMHMTPPLWQKVKKN